MVKNTWSGQPRERVKPAKDLSVQKRTKQATENVQCLASKNLCTGDQKKPNRQKAIQVEDMSPMPRRNSDKISRLLCSSNVTSLKKGQVRFDNSPYDVVVAALKGKEGL